MDPFTIVVGCLAIGSWLMNMVQAVETYTLWKMQRELPQRIEQGATQLLTSPKFQIKMVNTLTAGKFLKTFARTLAMRIKAIFDGYTGYDESVKKKFMGALAENEEVAGLTEFLPKKAQALLKAHPGLLELGLKIAGPFIEAKLGEMTDGEG